MLNLNQFNNCDIFTVHYYPDKSVKIHFYYDDGFEIIDVDKSIDFVTLIIEYRKKLKDIIFH